MPDFNKDDYLAGMSDADKLAHNPPAGADSDAGKADAAVKPAADTKADAATAAKATGAAPAADGTTDGDKAPAAGKNNGTADAESNADGSLTPLGQAKKEAADYLEALQRERAEFINYRNRMSKELDRNRQHGITDVLTALLPALDDIDRIREHDGMDDSFKAVAAKIDKAFAKFGVEKFGEKGEPFDPTKHEAVLHRQDASATTESVDAVVEAGYKIGDRVIRAARVVVVAPADDATAAGNAGSGNADTNTDK